MAAAKISSSGQECLTKQLLEYGKSFPSTSGVFGGGEGAGLGSSFFEQPLKKIAPIAAAPNRKGSIKSHRLPGEGDTDLIARSVTWLLNKKLAKTSDGGAGIHG